MEEIFVRVFGNIVLEKNFPESHFVSVEELIEKIDNLKYHASQLEEEIENLNREIEENYRRIDKYDELGISESDFY